MVEKQEQKVQGDPSAERIGKHPYSVATARVIAEIPHTEIGKPKGEITNLEQHKQRLHIIEAHELKHDHIIEVSTQERLGDPHAVITIYDNEGAVSKALKIEEANQKWRASVVDWLEKVSQIPGNSIATTVKDVYGLDVSNRESADKTLEQVRHAAFDRPGLPAGELNVEKIVMHFTHTHNEKGEEEGIQKENVVAEELTALEPFLYIFGGEKTVARLKHAILATSALLNAPVGSSEREELATQVADLLDQDIEPENAKHFAPFASSDPITLAVPIQNGGLTPPAAEGPIDPETVEREEEEQGKAGDGEFTGGLRERRGVEAVIVAGGASEEGGKPVKGEEGAPETQEDKRRSDQVRKEGLLDAMLAKDQALLDAVEWYKRAAKETPLGEITDGPLTGEGAWKDLISVERVPDNAEITIIGDPKQGDGFQVVTYHKNADAIKTPRNMIVFKTEGGQEVKVNVQPDKIEGRHFTVEGKYIRMGNVKWNQPLLREFSIPLELPGGTTEQVSGWVGVIIRPDGRVLTLLKNGAAAEFTTVRLAQMSATNYKDLTAAATLRAEASGNADKEKAYAKVFSQELLSILSKIYGNPEKFEEALNKGEVPWGDLSPANEDRIVATNKYFVLHVPNELADQLVENDQKRWSTMKELQAFGAAGVLNALGSASLFPLIA